MNYLTNNDNNIFLCYKELNESKHKNSEEKDLYDLLNHFFNLPNNQDNLFNNQHFQYFITKNTYTNDALFYDKEYKLKDLIKICAYYGLVLLSKYKKQEIIDEIILFESIPENAELVRERHQMWAYVTELLQNKKMKKYVCF